MSDSEYNFDFYALESMIGGLSTLDIPYISVQSREQGEQFILSYGYDVNKEEDLQKMWLYHRKAVTYIQYELLNAGEIIPVKLTDQNELGAITNLLIIASTKGNDLQRWACAILKVMHAYVHLENDLFAQFSNEIQDQILKPIQAHIHVDPVIGTTLGPSMGPKSILLKKFEMKSFKTSSSSVTKLLAKSELVAFGLLDKIGIRIVTKQLFDVFRVLRYFQEQNIVSFANNIAGQANNTLYPLNLFFETIESLMQDKDYTSDEVDQLLEKRLQAANDRASYHEKPNTFSSQDYRFVKFITRRLVRLQIGSGEGGKGAFTFFYPYEVQIVDYETYLNNMTGEGSHEKYKDRQNRRARARVLGV